MSPQPGLWMMLTRLYLAKVGYVQSSKTNGLLVGEPPLASWLKQSVFAGINGSLGPVPQIEAAENIRDVRFDRALADD